MNANALLQCFAGTLDQDGNIRHTAERQLTEASKTPGFLGASLEIIASSEVPENIKLSASLYFKNKISYGWNTNNYIGKNELLVFEVDNDEKPVIKDMLIQTMLSCAKQNSNCVRILKPALTVIINAEYPAKKWDDLLPKSLELLSSEDINLTHVGLICLSELFRTYRWKDNDSRQELEMLILQYFPELLKYATTVLFDDGKNMENPKIGEMLKLILKIYKFVSYHDLPFTLQRTESFIPWANFFVQIIQQPIPQSIFNLDSDIRRNNSWVKCKKWAYANLYRLFQRYASTSLTKKFEYNDFKKVYQEDFLPHFLQVLFQQIEQWNTKQLWLSDESLYYILNFIEQCIIQKSTWELVGGYYENILQHIIYPLLRPDEETLETFENDPQEYIHRNMELWDENYTPDLAALSLLTAAVHKRGKFTRSPTLEFITNSLNANVGDFNNISLENAVEIESSLRMFSAIIDILTTKNSPYFGQLEIFLKSMVFPFFKSPFGFLRTRVCEICSKLGFIDLNDPEIIPTIFEGVMSCFNEESDCVPVNLLAALALQAFIQHEYFQQHLSNIVVPTMQNLLALSNEFEMDTLSGVMQEFVEQFSEQLQPFGVDLMNTLVQQFLKLAIDLHEVSNIDPNSFLTADDVPDETEKQMAAIGVLSTTISILLSFENSIDIVKNLEQSFYPAAEFILKNDMEDFYHECCEFFENSTFLMRDISPIAWKVLELIGECNRKEESMVPLYLEDFMLVLNNFLVYGKDELKKNEFYCKVLFEVYQKAAEKDDADLDELKINFELSQKLTLALEQQLPAAIKEKFLSDAIDSIIAEKDGLKKNIVFGVTAFNVIVSNMIIDTPTVLSALKIKNCLEVFFETWVSSYIPNYIRTYDIKLTVLALLNMLCRVSADELLAYNLANFVGQICPLIMKLMAKYPVAIKLLDEKRKEFSTTDFNDGQDWDNHFNFDDNEDDNEGDNLEEVLEMLRGGGSGDLQFVDGLNDKEYFDDLDEDPLAGSILDDINIYEVVKGSMGSLEHSDYSKFTAALGTLSDEDREVYTQIMNV
ncbi:Nmd5p [Nakaseomyces bracarensis]|uniref:Nmd5p n=1 Tax=Nakaseomyces bracarensis TaxID=273131 RepID=UPI00387205F6